MAGKVDTTDNWNALLLAIFDENCYSEEALRAFGLIRPKPFHKKSKWDKPKMEAIREMRKAGLSWNKIGRTFNVAGASIYKTYYQQGPKVMDDWEPL